MIATRLVAKVGMEIKMILNAGERQQTPVLAELCKDTQFDTELVKVFADIMIKNSVVVAKVV